MARTLFSYTTGVGYNQEEGPREYVHFLRFKSNVPSKKVSQKMAHHDLTRLSSTFAPARSPSLIHIC